MKNVHLAVGGLVILSCSIAALVGGLIYWRSRGVGTVVTHLLSLAQTCLVAQVGLGLLLLADERRAGHETHYLYGALSLGAVLVPWFYAPQSGPRRLLWFAGMTALAAALAIRAFMTGGT